jgi:hypothetical protein
MNIHPLPLSRLATAFVFLYTLYSCCVVWIYYGELRQLAAGSTAAVFPKKSTVTVPFYAKNDTILYINLYVVSQLGNIEIIIGTLHQRKSTFTGIRQYIFLLFHLEELLKLYVNFFYRFCVTLLFLEIFEQKKSQTSELSAILDFGGKNVIHRAIGYYEPKINILQ